MDSQVRLFHLFENSGNLKAVLAADLDVLDKVKVEYETLAGWGTAITAVRTYNGLPDNCKKYVEYIEEMVGIRVEWIGVGAGRESMLRR